MFAAPAWRSRMRSGNAGRGVEEELEIGPARAELGLAVRARKAHDVLARRGARIGRIVQGGLRGEQQRRDARDAGGAIALDARQLGGEHVIEVLRGRQEAIEVDRILLVPEHRRDRAAAAVTHHLEQRVVAVIGIARDLLLPRVVGAAPGRLDEQQLRRERRELQPPRSRVDGEQRDLGLEARAGERIDDGRDAKVGEARGAERMLPGEEPDCAMAQRGHPPTPRRRLGAAGAPLGRSRPAGEPDAARGGEATVLIREPRGRSGRASAPGDAARSA